jgi:uroporphyrin-III C-methyltransferase
LTVALVGAGPGDPGLITVRALQLVRACEVLVHDRLVAPELVAEAPRDALRIDRTPLRQAEIEQLLVHHGRAGRAVVRLKGGDPFLFGRGGEEALALAQAGVPFEVVPGVSALTAVPAAVGIPVTHRGLASQLTVVAGHDPAALDYPSLARARGTLVFFMALSGLAEIAAGLIGAGLPGSTPAAVIASGTLTTQRSVTAPLARLANEAAELDPPALVVVGEVAALGSSLLEHELAGIAA